MICKEDIVSWFKELESYRRIDIMCTLLNMCLPFELRFLGTCLEELGRRDSQELRGIELRVNNPQELSSDIASCQSGEPTDLKIRRKMALYLALIRACNRSCVNELFKTLDSWGELDFQKLSDVDTLHELLLVYSMATNHPVFSFEQRFKCNEIFLKIQDNKLISGATHLSHSQHHPQQQPQQQQHQQQPFGDQQLHLGGQLHNLHGGPQQHLLHSIPLLPPGYIHQIIPSDGSIQHQLTVDGISHMIPNMALPSDFATHPNALFQIRPNMPSYPLPPQPPSLETQHPPQSTSPLLSQPTSPSNSRTASPNRSTSSGILQQTSGNQQQPPQIRNQQSQQQRITLRNSRRPSVETTPPPVVQSQQQQSQQLINLIGSEILPQSLKNMDELISADGTISQFNRNGYTRPGHHTIPRQSKSAMQHMQHHNQQQQLQQLPQHQHLQSFISSGGGGGGGPASLPPNFSGVNPNITYALQNMTLVDVHNPIIENNVMSSSTSSSLTSRGHKSSSTGGGAGSDSGSSGSTGDISPPETPTLNTSAPQGVAIGGNAGGGRLNDQTTVNYSNRRLNGRPEKLLTSVLSISGSNQPQQQLMYAPNATSPPQSQPQFHLGNDIILTTNPNLIQSPVSNNNNSSNNLINSIGSVVSGSSNNNLVTSTLVITTPQQQFSSGGTFPAPYHSQHLAAAMQAAAAAGTPARPPILSHNPGIGPAGIAPGTFRHPSFQIQSNGEHILYPYPPQVAAAALSQFLPAPPPPNAGQTSIHRSSPSTVTTGMPPPQQIVVSTSQQQQQSQQPQIHTQTITQTQSSSIGSNMNPNQSPNAALLTALPFTALTVGNKQIISCFNCGSQNHTGRECHEPSLEDVTRGAIYKLDYSTSAISPAAGGVSGNSSNISSNNSNNTSNSNTAIMTNNPSSTTTSIINNSSTNISNNSSNNSSQLNQNSSEILNETSSPASSSSSLSLSNK
ncbi:probable serine/threonine-protein kinase DDB_G0267686 [Condylostylus longicornis]|uniref:probable serine/threonine-protein kinase DDB_G0267686 n=1 Tax=Condylostylus longicornis TaxID=2530218 RepID=UPI00244E01A1|nr:probable serine/threonine-protein kinase DDB_G0267686 [Condylostylus longicornis]